MRSTVGGRRRNPRAHQGTDLKIGPAAKNSSPGCWDHGSGSQDPTGYEVGREFTLSDKSEFTETNKVIDFRALIRGFRTAALCRRAGTGRGAGVRKPRKEETAGRKRRGLAGRELWGFWGRGGIAHVAAGVEGGRCYREERTRRAFSGARMRAAGVGAAAGERLGRS